MDFAVGGGIKLLNLLQGASLGGSFDPMVGGIVGVVGTTSSRLSSVGYIRANGGRVKSGELGMVAEENS